MGSFGAFASSPSFTLTVERVFPFPSVKVTVHALPVSAIRVVSYLMPVARYLPSEILDILTFLSLQLHEKMSSPFSALVSSIETSAPSPKS